jgi:hypothetical protein
VPNSAQITHAKVSGKPQGTDPTRVYGNHWDAPHILVGLENVDNTSDASKPVSTAQAAALSLKASSTFTQTGIGATARPALGKLGETVSALDFGADSTGATDSTAAIQAAINAVQLTGGTVYFPAGTYKISSALTISSGFVSLVGSGRLSTLITTTSTTANILTISTSYVQVNNMSLTGPGAAVSTAGTAISATNCQGGSFTNLYIANVFSGILLNNSTNCLVQFVKVVNIYGPYILSSAAGGGDMIVCNQFDPVFYGNYIYSSGFGAWAQSTVYALNQVRSANGGFFVCSQAGTSAGAGTGPVVSPFGTQITDGTAKWLFITATGSAGISITAGANSNYIAFNDISGPLTAAISITNTDGTELVGNTIGQIIGNGLLLGASATNTLVQGNTFSGMYGQFATAIQDTNGSATSARIVDNYIQQTGWHAILLQSANAIVTGNNISGAGLITGSYGIEVIANTNSFNISDNVITTSGGMSGPIQVAAGTSDFYNITSNIIGSGVIADGGTGTHKTVFAGLTNAISAGTLADGTSALAINATQPAVPSSTAQVFAINATGNGSAAVTNIAASINYNAGYTGSALSACFTGTNMNAGTGNTPIPAAGSHGVLGNASGFNQARGSTAGSNFGQVGLARDGTTNIGILGVTQVPKNSAANIGVAGSAINTGTSPVHIGGFFSLNQTTVPTASAALIADNGSQSDPIARFRSNGADVATIGASGALLSLSPTAGLGYGPGAGGTVTQATSKATGVTLFKASGQITMNAASLAAGTIVSFALTNTAIAATDVLILNHISGGTVGSYLLNAQCGAGSATINVRNETAGALAEAIVIQYVLIKGVNA